MALEALNLQEQEVQKVKSFTSRISCHFLKILKNFPYVTVMFMLFGTQVFPVKLFLCWDRTNESATKMGGVLVQNEHEWMGTFVLWVFRTKTSLKLAFPELFPIVFLL